MTDKQLLDGLQENMSYYGKGWIARMSSNGRGVRLHETSLEEAVPSVREAIERFLESTNVGTAGGEIYLIKELDTDTLDYKITGYLTKEEYKTRKKDIFYGVHTDLTGNCYPTISFEKVLGNKFL